MLLLSVDKDVYKKETLNYTQHLLQALVFIKSSVRQTFATEAFQATSGEEHNIKKGNKGSCAVLS